MWQQIWFKHEFVREEDVWVDMKIAAKVAGREYGDGGALRRTGDIGGKKKKKKKRDEAVEMDVDEEEEVDDDAMDTDPPQDQSSPPPADLSSSTPQRPKHTPQPPPSSSSHSQLPRKGTSRILHPGRTYQALLDPVGDVSRKESKKSRFKKGKSKKGDLPAQTIHEEETGVNVLRWNGNVECGAWAAAATGCGLVVVEDCGI